MKLLLIIFLSAVMCLIIINLLMCAFYCHNRKKKSKNISNSPQIISYKNPGEEEKVSEKSSFKSFVSVSYNKVLSSILRYNLVLTSIVPSHHIRLFLYKFVFAMTIGKKAVIYYGAEIRSPWMISIGEGSIIGDKAILDGRYGIVIGKNVNFSTGVWLWTLQHDVNSPDFSITGQGAPITIGDRAWLSCRTVVLPGVSIGEGAVIAAGSVVTKDAESFSIQGGIPNKKIGERNKDLIYQFDGSHCHFF